MTGALLIAMRMEDYRDNLLVALDLGLQMQI